MRYKSYFTKKSSQSDERIGDGDNEDKHEEAEVGHALNEGDMEEDENEEVETTGYETEEC
jgi:hypothetical protein